MTAFRIIRCYTPGAFTAVMTALSVACIYQTFVIVAAAFNVEIPQ